MNFLLIFMAFVFTADATVCADGWVSSSTGRGTCSHHGGIKQYYYIPDTTVVVNPTEVKPDIFYPIYPITTRKYESPSKTTECINALKYISYIEHISKSGELFKKYHGNQLLIIRNQFNEFLYYYQTNCK